jgi:N-alpha-acetyltransferase 15/16, NatA auxiliary subunit
VIKNIPDYDVDHSEILLYHAQVLELLEDYTAALNFLDIKLSNRRIVDRHAALEARARLFSKLKRIDEADAAWRELIDLNPESLEYYEWLLTTHGLEIGKYR